MHAYRTYIHTWVRGALRMALPATNMSTPASAMEAMLSTVTPLRVWRDRRQGEGGGRAEDAGKEVEWREKRTANTLIAAKLMIMMLVFQYFTCTDMIAVSHVLFRFSWYSDV
jgi:hypothetical protein